MKASYLTKNHKFYYNIFVFPNVSQAQPNYQENKLSGGLLVPFHRNYDIKDYKDLSIDDFKQLKKFKDFKDINTNYKKHTSSKTSLN